MSNGQVTRRNRGLMIVLAVSLVLVFVPVAQVFASGSSETASQPAASGQKVHLDFWTFWGSETRRPIIEKIISDFNNSQDKIEVKHTYLPWGDIWTKNLASIAAGNPANVVVDDINSVGLRAQKNQITDITQYVNADKDNVKSWFFPALWNTVLYKDHVWAIPFTTDTRFMFYNKDQFKAAGLDPDNPPSTWQQLWDDAIKLDKKNSSGGYDRIGYYPLWGNFGYDTWLLNADNGTSWFNYKTGAVTIDTPEKVAAIKWINKWTARLGQDTVDSFKSQFGSQQADPFISGKLSIIITTGTFYTQIRDYGNGMNFGVAPVPERTAGSGHWSWGGGFVVDIPRGAKNLPESYQFLKYLGDTHAQEYWAAHNFDNVANIEGSKMAAKDSILSPEAQKVYSFAVDNMQSTTMTPTPVDAPDYINLIHPQIDAALLGKKSPEDALAQAQKDVEALVAQNK